jgi:hypothetical protein
MGRVVVGWREVGERLIGSMLIVIRPDIRASMFLDPRLLRVKIRIRYNTWVRNRLRPRAMKYDVGADPLVHSFNQQQ